MDKEKYLEIISFMKGLSFNRENIYLDEIEKIEDMILNKSFKVAVIGEFSVGKSTFLNALIGKRILYSSSKEATGVITNINNSRKFTAEVLFSSGNIKSISILENCSYKNLIAYLDRNSINRNKIISVKINYPIEGINKDVEFLDTPGLGGLDDIELNLTKDALKIANLIIVLIDNKGLTNTELQLLLGNNDKIGNIKNRKKLIIINKIGEFYLDNNIHLGNEKVNKLVSSVKKELIDNKIENYELFALDSRDYLWGVDNNLFEDFKKKSDLDILEKEEYLNRSRFLEFKTYLESYLDENSREQAFYEDLNEKLTMILISFLKQNNEGFNLQNKENLISKLDNQKNFIIDSKRKLKNVMIREIEQSILDFKESLENDIANDKKECQMELHKNINKNIISLESMNKKIFEKIIDINKDIIQSKFKKYTKHIEVYKKNLNCILYNSFDGAIKDVLKNDETLYKSVSFDLSYNINNVKFNLEEINSYKINENSNIYYLKKEIEENIFIRDSIYESIKQNLNDDFCKDEIFKCNNKLNKLHEERINKVSSLGERPFPKQKYKPQKKTKKVGFLNLFSEEYELNIPDGIDYTEVELWQEKIFKIEEEYLLKTSNIRERVNFLKFNIEDNKIKSQKLKNIEDDINFLNKRLEFEENNFKELSKKNIEVLFGSKLIKIEKEMIKIGINKPYRELYLKIINDLENNKDNIFKIIKTKIDEHIKSIDTSLEERKNELFKEVIYTKELEYQTNLKLKEYIKTLEVIKHEFECIQ